jgi:hypothetical protein
VVFWNHCGCYEKPKKSWSHWSIAVGYDNLTQVVILLVTFAW